MRFRTSSYRSAAFALLMTTVVAASAQEATVMQLLQNPRFYVGRRVSVSGYYYSDWEGHGIFADREAAASIDTTRGIWVAADPNVESPVRKAQVIGVFFYSSRRLQGGPLGSGYGVFGLYPATVVNATVHLH